MATKEITVLSTNLIVSVRGVREGREYRAVLSDYKGDPSITVQQMIGGEWCPTGGSWYVETLAERMGDSIYIDVGQEWLVESGMREAIGSALEIINGGQSERATDKVDRLYKAHQERVEGGFHNLLWQLLVNESATGAFTVRSGHRAELVIAQRDGGYISTHCFSDRFADLDDLADVLNQEVFGLDQRGAMAVVVESMQSRGAA